MGNHAAGLVVVQLHRIDGAAAELVVVRIRAEYRTEQYASTRALGVFSVPLSVTLPSLSENPHF